MDNKPNIFRDNEPSGLDLEKQSHSSGRGGAFFLTSLFIELIDHILSYALLRQVRPSGKVLTLLPNQVLHPGGERVPGRGLSDRKSSLQYHYEESAGPQRRPMDPARRP